MQNQYIRETDQQFMGSIMHLLRNLELNFSDWFTNQMNLTLRFRAHRLWCKTRCRIREPHDDFEIYFQFSHTKKRNPTILCQCSSRKTLTLSTSQEYRILRPSCASAKHLAPSAPTWFAIKTRVWSVCGVQLRSLHKSENVSVHLTRFILSASAKHLAPSAPTSLLFR